MTFYHMLQCSTDPVYTLHADPWCRYFSKLKLTANGHDVKTKVLAKAYKGFLGKLFVVAIH